MKEQIHIVISRDKLTQLKAFADNNTVIKMVTFKPDFYFALRQNFHTGLVPIDTVPV